MQRSTTKPGSGRAAPPRPARAEPNEADRLLEWLLANLAMTLKPRFR